MKHGPIALIDNRMPVVVLAPRDPPLPYEKMLGNVEEVRARGGKSLPSWTRTTGPLDELADERAARSRHPGAARAAGGRRPAAAARLPCGGLARERRGPAPQPGEERHGRVAGLGRCLLSSLLPGHGPLSNTRGGLAVRRSGSWRSPSASPGGRKESRHAPSSIRGIGLGLRLWQRSRGLEPRRSLGRAGPHHFAAQGAFGEQLQLQVTLSGGPPLWWASAEGRSRPAGQARWTRRWAPWGRGLTRSGSAN